MEDRLGTWGLDSRQGELWWDNCSLVELANRYGTPLYVINKQRILDTYPAVVDAFTSAGLNVAVFYSIKTNPLPALLTELIQQGCGAEVISDYELWLSRKLGLAGDQIIVNGSAKSTELLRQAVETGVRLINIENENELHRLREISRQLDRQVNIGIRINPGLRRTSLDFTVSTGSSVSPMGFHPGGEAWHRALDLLRDDDSLIVKGIHFHIGSGIGRTEPYKQALRRALQAWVDLQERGFQPEAIDMGGGFSIPTLKTLNLWEAIRLFGWGKPARLSANKSPKSILGEVGRVCARIFQEFSQRHGTPEPELLLEPGRALSASTQLLLLTVQEVVERGRRPPVAICNGGAASLSNSLLSEQHVILLASAAHSDRTRPCNIMGNMPMNLDIVALRQKLPELSRGDVLAVMDTGAYFTSLGNTFAGPRPAIVLIDGGQPELVRRRETYRDLVARDEHFST